MNRRDIGAHLGSRGLPLSDRIKNLMRYYIECVREYEGQSVSVYLGDAGKRFILWPAAHGLAGSPSPHCRGGFRHGAEAILDSVPLVSMVAAGVIEGRNLLAGRHTLRESLRRGAKRTGRAAVYNAVGTLLGPAGVPVALTLRVAETRMTGRIALGDHLESKTLEIRRLTPQA